MTAHLISIWDSTIRPQINTDGLIFFVINYSFLELILDMSYFEGESNSASPGWGNLGELLLFVESVAGF